MTASEQATLCSRFKKYIHVITGASSPPRQPRQLPWLIFETTINYKKWPKQLGRFEDKRHLYFSTKHKKDSLNNKYPWSSMQIWRNRYFFHSTKQKKLLKNICSSLHNWRNKYFYYSTKQKKKLFKYTEFSLQNWKEMNIFIILQSKKTLLKYPGSSLQNWKKIKMC